MFETDYVSCLLCGRPVKRRWYDRLLGAPQFHDADKDLECHKEFERKFGLYKPGES